MKAFVVLDNDISFFSVDAQFKRYILQRCVELKIVEEVTKDREEDLLRDAITQYFMQFAAAVDVLDTSLGRPMQSVTGADNSITVIRKFRHNLYIAYNGDGEESENVLIRKIYVFQRLLGFLFGPVIDSIKPSNLEKRKQVWEKLSGLLTTYSNLYLEDQVFLLEALEPIHFGLGVVQEQCLKLVNVSMDHLTNGGIRNVAYTMLLVNTKILAIKGRQSKPMGTADKLLITLVVANKFYSKSSKPLTADEVDLDDVTPNEDDDDMSSGPEEGIAPGSPLYETPNATPGLPQGKLTPAQETVSEEEEEETSDHEFDEQHFEKEKNAAIGSKFKSAFNQFRRMFLDDVGDGDNLEPILNLMKQAKHAKELVFLQPYTNYFIPHYLHCVEIRPGIVLILVEEFTTSPLAGTICQALNSLHVILSPEKEKKTYKPMFELLEDNMKKIADMTRKEIQETGSRLMDNALSLVQANWNKAKGLSLQSVFEEGRRDIEEHPQGIKITAIVTNIVNQMHKLFDELFIVPRLTDYDKRLVKRKLITASYPLCRDYGDFLSMKAEMNIPIISYSSRYEGLIHFIMVDRLHNEVVSPTIQREGATTIDYVNEIVRDKNISPAQFLHQKVWKMVLRSQKYFMLGYTSQTWLDEYFFYSYYLWLAMPHNTRDVVERMILPNSFPKQMIPPGILTSDCYKDFCPPIDLPTSSATCYEFYCMHKATQSSDEVAKQCRQLIDEIIRQLSSHSGAGYISLLQ